jgi:hypothetical protein
VAPRGRLLVVLGLTVTHGKIVEIDMVADPARLRQFALAVLNDNDGDTVCPGTAARMPTPWHLPKYWQPPFGTRFTRPSRDGASRPGVRLLTGVGPDARGVAPRLLGFPLTIDSRTASAAERPILGGGHTRVIEAAMAWDGTTSRSAASPSRERLAEGLG